MHRLNVIGQLSPTGLGREIIELLKEGKGKPATPSRPLSDVLQSSHVKADLNVDTHEYIHTDINNVICMECMCHIK